MTKIKVKISKTYNIYIGKNLLSCCGKLIKEAAGGKKAVIISDDLVFPIYGGLAKKSLSENGYEVLSFVFPHGEKQKNADTFIKILEFLGENNVSRSDVIVSLGGGVSGDISGFSAASFKRGINLVHIPTSLLSMVDSSVGGKTAINLASGKNLAGAFYQPSLVLIDTDTLKTLPAENFSEGLAEVIKYGVLKSPEILDWVKNPHENIQKIIELSIKIKSDIVEIDEFDLGERQTLNLGHTVGHAIEILSNFKISHGNAVAIGMSIISKAAEVFGDAQKGTHEKIVDSLKSANLPYETSFSPEEILKYMLTDKKADADTINLIIPKNLGECEIKRLPIEDLLAYISAGLKKSITLFPKSLSGEVKAPFSKSYVHRLLICAALSKNPSKLIFSDTSEDIEATKNILTAIGAKINKTPDGLNVTPIDFNALPKHINADCKESGSTLRFLLPVISALGINASLEMKGRLPNRPLSPLYELLLEKGVTLSEMGKSPLSASGKLHGNSFKIKGDVSSQFISGLLFALPLLGGGDLLIEGKIESEGYINMTLDTLRLSGIEINRSQNKISAKGTYSIPSETFPEGDFSNGAFWICAGAIGKNPLKITNLNPDSLQGDKKILEIAKSFGAEIFMEKESITVIPSFKRKKYRCIADS